MTAIAVTAPAIRVAPSVHRRADGVPRTRLRLTVRGRRVLAFVAALPLAIAVGFGVLSGGAALAERDGAPSTDFAIVTVGWGDTLWSIAQEVAPAADPRDVVDAIVRLNGLDDGVLLAGEQIAIPAEYSAAP